MERDSRLASVDNRLPTAVGMFIGVVGSILVAGLLSEAGDWARVPFLLE